MSEDGDHRLLRVGREVVSSARRNKTPQMKPGLWRDVICTMRLMKAFTRASFASDLSDLNRRLRYKACLDELVNRRSSKDSYNVR